jgi:hypothetical protein
MRIRFPVNAVLPLLLLCALTLRGGAQAAGASIAGSVTDSTGAAVPGASITVRNTDLATVRAVSTDRAGAFNVSGLIPGAYSVEAKANKLELRRPVRVTLTVGSSVQLALSLEVARDRQSVTVRGRAGLVEGNTVAPVANTAESAVTTFFPGLTVTYLPNRDRDFTQFTSQTPGADDDGLGGVSFAGQRAAASAMQVDGVSYNDPLLGGPRGAEDGGVALPIGVVREFELVPGGNDATVGQTGAGLVNVATKGGANRPRGDAFYTVRPTPFTSADAFGNTLDALLNSFGLAESGPIRKNLLFYSVGLEQDFIHAPYYATFAPQNPSSAAIPAEMAAEQGQIVEEQSPTLGFGRLDWVLSQRNTLTASLALDRIRSTNAGDGLARTLAVPLHASRFGGQSASARIGLTTVLSSNAFNQAMLAYSGDHRQRTPLSDAPELFINGFGILGGDGAGAHRYTSGQWQAIDNVTLARGRNEFALGGRFAASPADERREPNLNARFDYNSLADYLAANPRRFQQTIPGAGVPAYQETVYDFGLFANARIALTQTLFLTAGLRWNGQWNPRQTAAAAASLPAAVARYTLKVPDDLKQWQPRLGLAWNLSSKTTLRLSAGIYDTPTPAAFFHRVFTDGGSDAYTLDSYFDPSLIALSGGNTASPRALGGLPAGLTTYYANVVGISPGFRNPASLQAAASVEQQIDPKLDLTFGYLRGGTWGLERRLDENLNAPVGSLNGNPVFPSARPIAGVGRLLVEQSNAHSTYDGGFLNLRAPINARSTLIAAYTLSRNESDDDSTGPYSPVTAVNPFSLAQERAYSLLDARSTLNLNAIFNLPLGFKANPLFSARSGQPYTPIIGFDTSNDANDTNDRATVNGNVAARNSQRQPALSSLDARFVKDFTLKGEGHHLDLFLDFFNLAGAQNRRFDANGFSYCGDAENPVYSALTPLFASGITRPGGARTAQFTVRLVGF